MLKRHKRHRKAAKEAAARDQKTYKCYRCGATIRFNLDMTCDTCKNKEG